MTADQRRAALDELARIDEELGLTQAPAEAHGDEREAFETWAEACDLPLDESLSGIPGSGPIYVNAETVMAWEGWNARAALNVQPKGTCGYCYGTGKADDPDAGLIACPQGCTQAPAPAPDLDSAFCGYGAIVKGEYKLASMRSNAVMNDGELHPLYTFSNEQIEQWHAARQAQAQAPSPAVGADERAAFEAWAGRSGYYTKRSDKNPERYHAWLTNALWDGWQGRAAQATAAAEPTPEAPPIRTGGCTLCGHCAATGERIVAAGDAPAPAPSAQPGAWMYEHDGCLEKPIVTTTRWSKCEEPWTETPLFGLAGFVAARDAGLIPEVDSETWAEFRSAVDEGRAPLSDGAEDAPEPNEREEFERWAEQRDLPLDEQLSGIPGAGPHYVYVETAEAWEAWQARSGLFRPPVQPLERRERDVRGLPGSAACQHD